MLTKITIIVTGLVSMVPHGSNEGMTVLMRDALLSTPRVELASGEECRVSVHVPLVLQPEGRCEGDCLALNSFGSAPGEQLVGSWLATPTSPTKDEDAQTLRWLPFQQSLELERVVPQSMEAHDFQYGFRMGGGVAKVDPDCLGDSVSCPIIGRFELPAGGFRACHLAQVIDEESQPSRSAGFEPVLLGQEIFSENPGALGDAYSVELMTYQTPPFILHAKNFAGGRTMRTAKLYPDEKGRLTLLIANLPLRDHARGDGNGDRCHELVGQVHSASLYDLAAGNWGPQARLVAHYVGPTKANVTLQPGRSCSDYFRNLESLDARWAALLKAFEYPSNPGKCHPGMILGE